MLNPEVVVNLLPQLIEWVRHFHNNSVLFDNEQSPNVHLRFEANLALSSVRAHALAAVGFYPKVDRSVVSLPQQSRLELGLRLSRRFSGANDLDCWRASRRRKALRCARGWKADGVCRTRIGDSLKNRCMLIGNRFANETRFIVNALTTILPLLYTQRYDYQISRAHFCNRSCHYLPCASSITHPERITRCIAFTRKTSHAQKSRSDGRTGWGNCGIAFARGEAHSQNENDGRCCDFALAGCSSCGVTFARRETCSQRKDDSCRFADGDPVAFTGEEDTRWLLQT
jgi:hypothetical protein